MNLITPKVTWQPYPATRPTEPSDYFVTLIDVLDDFRVEILSFNPKRDRFCHRLKNDKRVIAWAPLSTAHLVKYDEEKPSLIGRYMIKLATSDAVLPFTYHSIFFDGGKRFLVIKEKDAQIIAWGHLPKPFTGDHR